MTFEKPLRTRELVARGANFVIRELELLSLQVPKFYFLLPSIFLSPTLIFIPLLSTVHGLRRKLTLAQGKQNPTLLPPELVLSGNILKLAN